MSTPKGRVKEFTDDEVRDLSESVYRQRLGDEDTLAMIEKDGDFGHKLRQRAACFDQLSRCYLRAFNELAGG
jgi:hypothetical protein